MTDNPIPNVSEAEGQSADIVAGNIDKLKEIFPDAIAEGGVNFDTLRQILGDASVLDEGEEKYGLNWHGKKKARQIALTPSTGTLLPCPEESVDWDTTQNLFIEGDNLEVLKLLQKSYANKVKMIYIDPPYNTGKDFVYPDDYKDNLKSYLNITGQLDSQGAKVSTNTEAGGRKHANWLSMMLPRIHLARQLLAQNGAMFVSIDDNEQANLKKLCDAVLGEENFIANIVWQKKYTRANDAKWFSDNHDHVLCYAKNKEKFDLNQLPRSQDQLEAYKNPDNHAKGVWKSTPLHAKSGTNNSSYTFKNGVTWTPPTGTFRRFNDETMNTMDLGDEIWFGVSGNQTPARKSFLSEIKGGVTPVTIWPYDEVGHNHEANTELKNSGLGGLFNNPKPTRLIKRMIELTQSETKDDLIVDFFAGSGTTAEAVLSANAEDGGTRRFIVVQLPEAINAESPAGQAGYKSIAELTLARTKSANQRYKVNSRARGVKAFKLAASNITSWNPDKTDIEATLLNHTESLVEGRSEQDILYELLLKRGVELTVPIEEKQINGKTIHSIGYGVLFACLDKSIISEEAEAIAQTIVSWHKELGPETDSHVFFRDSAFADDVTKSNMAAILDQNGISHVRSL